jgi:ABC-type lipoprotein release transport system permease subunit
LATNVDRARAFATHNPALSRRSAREESMMSAMAAFGIAVGGATLICYALMT